MLEAIQAKSASVAVLGLANRDTPRAILTLIISDLVKFLNVGMSMSVNQVQMTVEMLMNDILTKNLKPEDYKVCFDQFKKSGKSYNRVDGQTIFEIVYKYAQEKADFMEMMSINEHGAKTSKTPLVPKEVIEMYKEADRLRKEGKLKTPEVVPVKIDILDNEKAKYQVEWGAAEDHAQERNKRKIQKSPRDQFIQDCFLEFSKLWAKKKYIPPRPESKPGMVVTDGSGAKYILWEGEPVDEVEYTEIKLKEYDKAQKP